MHKIIFHLHLFYKSDILIAVNVGVQIMNWIKILFFAFLTLLSACSDENSDNKTIKGNTQSLIIYQQNSADVRKGYFVEVANTREAMAKGLMGRSKLDKDSGFLFNVDLIPSDMEIAMWMKDTLIPLDMLFIDRNGKIYFIYENAEPYSTNAIMAPTRPRAVLEINGSQVKEFGIKIGDLVKTPLLGNM